MLKKKENVEKKIIICAFVIVISVGIAIIFIEKEQIRQQLIIPNISEIKENGYPLNENGESYGPDIKDWTDLKPDLVLAENKYGVKGYIKVSELQKYDPVSLEEAKNYQKKTIRVNLYLQDGETIIGSFCISD